MQKKWSHIDPQLFSPLDVKEVSLKVNKFINFIYRQLEKLLRCFAAHVEL